MTWNFNNLTLAVDTPPAPPAATGTLIAYTLGHTQHVLYRGAADNHIHELWWDTAGWHTNDLTLAAGAPDIVPGKHLVGFSDSSTQHVFFVDYPKGDLHELRWDGSTGWHDHDLSITAGVPAPLPTTQFAAWVDDTGGKVVYQDTAYAIWQLDWSGGSWHLPPTLLLSPGRASGAALTGYSGDSPGTPPAGTTPGTAEYVGYQWGNRVGQLLIPLKPPGSESGYLFTGVTVPTPTTGLASHNQRHYSGTPPHLNVIPHLQCIEVDGNIWTLSLPDTVGGVNLTSKAKAPVSGQMTLVGWFSSISGYNEVFYLPPSGDVSAIEWGDDAEGPWQFYQIVTGAPGAASPLAGYYWAESNFGYPDSEHVFFIGSQDQSVHEAWRSTP